MDVNAKTQCYNNSYIIIVWIKMGSFTWMESTILTTSTGREDIIIDKCTSQSSNIKTLNWYAVLM